MATSVFFSHPASADHDTGQHPERAEDLVDRYRLSPHLRLGTTVRSARYDEPSAAADRRSVGGSCRRWRVSAAAQRLFFWTRHPVFATAARHVVNACPCRRLALLMRRSFFSVPRRGVCQGNRLTP